MRAGQRIGKYVLDERIAVGGMAEVWAARMEGPEGFTKTVALKFILESFAGDPELEHLFVNEARIAARLQHANLVTVFDFDKVAASAAGADHDFGLAGRYYIAMERVEGQDLRRLADAAKRAGYLFPLGVALHLAGEALKALRYVHERREHGQPLDLVHRDVSPHNVLVGYSGEVKLSDFGIAKTRAHSSRTKTGTVRGKLAYASPEQLNGERVDHRTDQFALGVTLWELLAGRRLFDGRDELETIGNVVRCAVPALAESSLGHAVPPAVEAVVRRMLSPRREHRFPTTGEALSAVLALPGYLPDGTELGDLVRTLFLPQNVEIPATMPIQALSEAAAAAARDAVTKTMQKKGARAGAPGGGDVSPLASTPFARVVGAGRRAGGAAGDGTPVTARARPSLGGDEPPTKPEGPAPRGRAARGDLAGGAPPRRRLRARAPLVAGLVAAVVVAVAVVTVLRVGSDRAATASPPAMAGASGERRPPEGAGESPSPSRLGAERPAAASPPARPPGAPGPEPAAGAGAPLSGAAAPVGPSSGAQAPRAPLAPAAAAAGGPSPSAVPSPGGTAVPLSGAAVAPAPAAAGPAPAGATPATPDAGRSRANRAPILE